MPDPLRIRIRPDWDTALTYDSLYDTIENRSTRKTNGTDPDTKAGSRAVFVGRETIIAPLVAEIAEPNKRGTYLISGYRGTGKTTLIIEALRRAQKQLEAGEFRLFPVVLNVSEVSASLGNASQATSASLNIDPRRLLTALIRQIRDGLTRVPLQSSTDEGKKEALRQLSRTVNFAYDKATAVKFSVAATNATENTRTRSREVALALENKNLLKAVAAIAAAGALALEAGAWLPNFGSLHAVALFLSGVFAISLVASYKLSHSEKWTDSRQTALEHDNSLQQLETDLKDILADLKKNGLRTVVVLEELDKLDDPKGLQLAAVIRYFKNLFTQAPALFFFVTDKGYFDIIASAIKRARRSRSYAVEHTFFTHRIFVGRQTTEESLKFIAAIADDEKDRKAIEAVADTLGRPGRTNEVDQLGLFVRVVLFNAANHLFDLKNELRRYARNEAQQVNGKTDQVTSLIIDEQTLPVEQAAVASFQDLIVEKTRSFEIKGGRAYANETLADSLYAVFNELGSNQPQQIESFFPSGNSKLSEGLLLDEQLDLSEAARVCEAVESLIGDLERGAALHPRDPAANTFTWRDDAARSFRYFRQLQKHEDALIAEVERSAALVGALPPSDQNYPSAALDLKQRAGELRSAPEPLSADAAAAQQREIRDLYGSALAIAFRSRQKELSDTYQLVFEQVAQGLGGSLHLVRPTAGDPRLATSGYRGAVLLAFGETETMAEDVWSFIRPTSPGLYSLRRAALVHVIHQTGDLQNEVLNRKAAWNDFFSTRAAGIEGFTYAVDVVPLVGAGEDGQVLNPTERTAATLVGFGEWVTFDHRPYEKIPQLTPDLTDALLEWKNSQSKIFHIDGIPTTERRSFLERDAFEKDGTVVIRPEGSKSFKNVFEAIAVDALYPLAGSITPIDSRWGPLGQWLVATSRVILYLNPASMDEWGVDQIVKLVNYGARLIIMKEGELPRELMDFFPTLAPAPPTPDQEPNNLAR